MFSFDTQTWTKRASVPASVSSDWYSGVEGARAVVMPNTDGDKALLCGGKTPRLGVYGHTIVCGHAALGNLGCEGNYFTVRLVFVRIRGWPT